jgi:hypothetical protein
MNEDAMTNETDPAWKRRRLLAELFQLQHGPHSTARRRNRRLSLTIIRW